MKFHSTVADGEDNKRPSRPASAKSGHSKKSKRSRVSKKKSGTTVSVIDSAHSKDPPSRLSKIEEA